MPTSTINKNVVNANTTATSQETTLAIEQAKAGLLSGDTTLAKGWSIYAKTAVDCVEGWICTNIDLAFVISDVMTDNTLSTHGKKLWIKTVTILLGGIDIQDDKIVYAPQLSWLLPPDKNPKAQNARLFWQLSTSAKKSQAQKNLDWLKTKFTFGKKIAFTDVATFVKSLKESTEDYVVDIQHAVKMLEKWASGKRKPTDNLRNLIQRLRNEYNLV